jgi:hypothetical protein
LAIERPNCSKNSRIGIEAWPVRPHAGIVHDHPEFLFLVRDLLQLHARAAEERRLVSSGTGLAARSPSAAKSSPSTASTLET